MVKCQKCGVTECGPHLRYVVLEERETRETREADWDRVLWP